MRKLITLLSIATTLFAAHGCKKNDTEDTGPKLRFKFVFDNTLPRLNNFGQEVTALPSGHSAQSPSFNLMGAHYIELAPNANTALGTGDVLYKGEETTQGGEKALIFDKEKLVANNEEFYSIPLKNVTAGTYEWLRVSLAYQNYDIDYRYSGQIYHGTIASFIGYNTYINSYKVKTQNINIDGNKKQGYWGFETTNFGITTKLEGQVPAGGTTVPNPLFGTSGIPAGSCVVTGSFPNGTPLVITGNETEDITIVVKVSTNKSFEWIDNGNDGYYDTDPNNTDAVVDMGVRGIFPEVE